MWIQIRTIDGKETRTVEDLSRLTKIESLRVKIRDIFNVKPEQQRLFYRGKQVRAALRIRFLFAREFGSCATVQNALTTDPDSARKLPASEQRASR